MAGRPRRTRIYGANYNIGESYYKSALDNLNRKQIGSSNEDSGKLKMDIPKLDQDPFLELTQPKSIMRRALTEEPTVFNYRGREATLNPEYLIDGDLDEDVQATLRKIRGVRKANSSFLEENNAALDETHRRKGLEVGRLLKSLYDSDDNDANEISSTRLRKNLSKDETFQSTSSASLRANATKVRLANIESEMSERFEKQIQREKRSANLKKLLNETDTESSRSVKKVTF